MCTLWVALKSWSQVASCWVGCHFVAGEGLKKKNVLWGLGNPGQVPQIEEGTPKACPMLGRRKEDAQKPQLLN